MPIIHQRPLRHVPCATSSPDSVPRHRRSGSGWGIPRISHPGGSVPCHPGAPAGRVRRPNGSCVRGSRSMSACGSGFAKRDTRATPNEMQVTAIGHLVQPPLGEALLVHLQSSGHHGWVGGGLAGQGVSDRPRGRVASSACAGPPNCTELDWSAKRGGSGGARGCPAAVAAPPLPLPAPCHGPVWRSCAWTRWRRRSAAACLRPCTRARRWAVRTPWRARRTSLAP